MPSVAKARRGAGAPVSVLDVDSREAELGDE